MPHLTIEYSEPLEAEADIAGLCRDLHAALIESGLFELGAVRVRAFPARHHAIADLDPRNGFLDIALRIGAGRTPEEARRAGDLLFAAAARRLAAPLAGQHFALSLEVREIDAALSWKRNAIHPRLRAAG